MSSLHDGMNLVAKEFVAARDDERGVLVLSHFTGAARELTEALIVNPYDLEEASAALAAALAHAAEEQRDRMRAMRAFVAEFNVYRWAGRMLVDAARLRRRERLTGGWAGRCGARLGPSRDALHPRARQRDVLEQFAWSKVLLAFDFDGRSRRSCADPDEAAMRASTARCSARSPGRYPCVVISGRARADVLRRVRGVRRVAEVIGNHGIEPGHATRSGAAGRAPMACRSCSGAGRIQGVDDRGQGPLARGPLPAARARTKAARARILEAAARLGEVRLIGGQAGGERAARGRPHKGLALERARARFGLRHRGLRGRRRDRRGRLRARPAGPAAERPRGPEAEAPRPATTSGARPRSTACCAPCWSARRERRIGAAGGRAHEGEAAARRTRDGEALPPLGEPLEFMRLLWAIDHGLQMRSKRMAATLGVTGPQRLVIRIVGRFPGVSAGQLAGILHLHPSTLTGVLKRLERAGLLARRRDPRDARRAVLGLSAAGRRLDVMTAGTIESVMHEVLAKLPRHKVRFTREVLAALARRLEEDPPA